MRWIAVFGLATGLGCSSGETSKEADQAAQAVETHEGAGTSAVSNFDRTPALTKADVADGVEDKVATQCAGCSLAMEGYPEHTIEVDGYELHMCAGECKANFETDLDTNLKTLIQ